MVKKKNLEKGISEDEMIEWHHRFNGHEFEQTQEDSDRQGSLACCSLWGSKCQAQLRTEKQ